MKNYFLFNKGKIKLAKFSIKLENFFCSKYLGKFLKGSLVFFFFCLVSCQDKDTKHLYLHEHIKQNEENPESFKLTSTKTDTISVESYLATENFLIQKQIEKLKQERKNELQRIASIHLSSRTSKQKEIARKGINKDVSLLEEKVDSLKGKLKKLKDPKTKNEIFYIGTLYNYTILTNENKKSEKQYIVIKDGKGNVIHKGEKPARSKIANKFSVTYL